MRKAVLLLGTVASIFNSPTLQAQTVSPACEAEYRAELNAIDSKRHSLPGKIKVCDLLGIPRSSCDKVDSFMGHSNSETDPSKWVISQYSSSNEYSSNVQKSCHNAIPIEEYGTIGGGTGTTYACFVAVSEDDHITDEQLNRFINLAHRLNSIAPKTLMDHQLAMEVKNLIIGMSGNQ